MDSAREFIGNFDDKTQLGELGFEKPEDEEAGSDDEDPLGELDDFISKIATMLTSLVEGSEDTEIIGKMCFSL